MDWEVAEPAAVLAARVASGGWSRLIRPPRKRNGHVVLDFCSAVPPAADYLGSAAGGTLGEGGVGGALVRQVVSRAAARRDAGGAAPYRLSRRLRWGDLWPHHYQRSFREEEAGAEG